MIEKLNEALEELKRVDHLIYVSLKYTRTVDVIVNIISRMVDGYVLIVDALLEQALEKGTIEHLPASAVERAELVRRMYADDQLISDNMGLYILLRKLLRARHVTRENEYRRHVTMKTVVEGREEIVNIDIITNYCLFQREFLMHIKSMADGRISVPTREVAVTESPSGWGDDEEPELQEREETTVVHRTPPKKATVKIRPVGAPPRKRAPRPKKYKIQIPKSATSISLPYEYDPHFRKELERERARLKLEEDKKAKAAKKAAKKPAKKAKRPVKKVKGVRGILKKVKKALRRKK